MARRRAKFGRKDKVENPRVINKFHASDIERGGFLPPNVMNFDARERDKYSSSAPTTNNDEGEDDARHCFCDGDIRSLNLHQFGTRRKLERGGDSFL